MSLTDRLNAKVAANLDAAFASGLPKHIVIAVSGGGDSMALLHLTRAWASVRDVTLSACLLYTSPSPRDPKTSRMPSSA